MSEPTVTPTTVTPAGTERRDEAALLPPVDVFEDAGGTNLRADQTGTSRDRLHLRVEADTLAIEADTAPPLTPNLTPSHVEVQLARYRRRFTLSKELDPTRIVAELNHGVLRVRIPKAEHAQPRRIDVRVG